MKSFFKILIIVVTILCAVGILTKPSDKKCYDTVKEKLEAAHHKVAIYLSHDKPDDKKVVSSITIKDRVLYKDIYFFELGANKKVAVGAINRIYLIAEPK
jgi:hypothetical protein